MTTGKPENAAVVNWNTDRVIFALLYAQQKSIFV